MNQELKITETNLEEKSFWPEDIICSILEALEQNDEIYINSRKRHLTVLGFEEQISNGVVQSPDYPYHIWWLEGNGTTYRLRWSHTHKYRPMLHTESELETYEIMNYQTNQMEQSTRSKSNTGETVQRVSVNGIDDNQLSDFVLSRQFEFIDE